jgi:hypothetical protein
MKALASFDEWKRDQSAKNQRLIDALSGLVKNTAPEFTPTVKWGQGCWTLGDAPKVYIHAEPDHVQFGFYAGSKLKDPEGLLVGSGKNVRHVTLRCSRRRTFNGRRLLLSWSRCSDDGHSPGRTN